MYIITGSAAEHLRNNYSVLRLETLPNGEQTFCVLTSDSIPLSEIGILETLQRQHEQLLVAWETKNHKLVQEILPGLKGKFNGAVDSFYESIEHRLSSST